MRIFKLIHLLSWRGLTSGKQLIYVAALSLAVSCFCLTLWLNNSLQLGIAQQQASAAASELVITSQELNLQPLAKHLTDEGFKVSQQITFNNLIASEAGFSLSQILAVDNAYPLLGELTLQQATGKKTVNYGPAVGEIWLEPSLAARLNVNFGDLLEVGSLNLKFTAQVVASPQASQQLISLAPKAWVNLASIENTYLLSAYARFTNQLNLLSPTSYQKRTASANYLEEQLALINNLIDKQEVTAEAALSRTANNPLNRALTQLEELIKLVNLTNLLFACLAVVLASFNQLNLLSKTYALLSSLGVTKAKALAVQVGQICWLATLASFIGLVLAYLALIAISASLAGYLGFNLASLAVTGFFPVVLGWLFSLALALSLAATPLAKIARLSIWEALQGKTTSLQPWGWLSFSLTLALLFFSAHWLTSSWLINLISLGSLLLALAGITFLGWLLFKLIKPGLVYLPWSLNKALARLVTNPATSLVQLSCFTLVLTLVVLTSKLSGQLLVSWQNTSFASKPNVFALDIPPNETQQLNQLLTEQQLFASDFYPLTRARLTHINSQPAKEQLSAKAQQDNSLHRELNLTWAEHLPTNNELTAGDWWPKNTDKNFISIEEELAKRLNLQLGDTLGFTLAGNLLEGEIINFRKVDWLDMQPNFFIIFSPASLETDTASYLASFHLPANSSDLLATLHQAFPTTSFIDLRQLAQQLNQILGQLNYLLKLLLGFTLVAGVLVSLALLQASQKTRQQENFLLNVFGATSQQLKAGLTLEFAALGLIAGVLANFLAEISYGLVVKLLIPLSWQPQLATWLALPLVAALFLGLLARLGFKQG